MSKKIKQCAAKLLCAAISSSMLFGIVAVNANAQSIYSKGINSPNELLDFQYMMSKSKNTESLLTEQIKHKAMYDYARTVAIRAAMSSNFDSMQNFIDTHSRELDAIYNFEPLMIQQRVVPPVITEARDLYNQSSTMQIRLSKAIFNIDKQAYFSSNAPNWRDYLTFPIEQAAYSKYAYAGGDLMPKSKEEKAIWQEATLEGWKVGERQSGVVLEQAMQRLNRDYTGMIKFHTLALEGRITMPSVSNYNLYDTNSGNRLILGEELLQIDVLPTFKNTLIPQTYGRERLMKPIKITQDSIVQKPQGIEKEPIREVYQVVEKVRNDKDFTSKPWKDTLPLSRSKNPLERPVTINIEESKQIRPVVVSPVKTNITREQVNEMKLVEDALEPTEPPLRPYESPL